MDGRTIKTFLMDQVKPLLLILPLNMLIALLYCYISKKMSIVPYADALLIIGGVYAGIGGLSYVGAENIGTANQMLIRREGSFKKSNESFSKNFNTTLLLAGILTIVISYVIGTFR